MLPASAYLEMALAAAVEVFGTQSVALQDIEFRKALFLPEGASPYDSGDPLSRRGWRGILSHLQSRGRRGARRQIMDAACHRQGLSSTGHQQHRPGCRAGDAYRNANALRGDDLRPGLLRGTRKKAASTTVRSFKASPGCGGATERCWLRCRCPMGRRRTLLAGTFTRQCSMPGCRFSGLRLRPERPKAADKEFTCRPASTSSGCTVIQAIIYGVTRGCGIGRRMPRQETCSSSMKRDAWRSRFRDSALNIWAKIRTRASVDHLDDWLYEFVWQPKELAAENSDAPAGRASWLIFADSGGVGDALSALLEARGERSILVAAGELVRANGRRALSHPPRTTGGHKPALRGGSGIRSAGLSWRCPSLEPRRCRSRGDHRGLAERRPDSGLRQCPAAGATTGPDGIA